jgi:hypothetical protein
VQMLGDFKGTFTQAYSLHKCNFREHLGHDREVERGVKVRVEMLLQY